MDGHAILSATEEVCLIENEVYLTDDDVFEGDSYSEPNPELYFYFDCQILTGSKAKILFVFKNSQEEKVQLVLTIDGDEVEQEYVY
ncbi:hypothetical protein FACS1894159_03150 [Bacteroidia bacterium]|nr:hypothetical protein FACS1894159_03150 [Bacteroidia bacterium]